MRLKCFLGALNTLMPQNVLEFTPIYLRGVPQNGVGNILRGRDPIWQERPRQQPHRGLQ
jgi:hypothetical protein